MRLTRPSLALTSVVAMKRRLLFGLILLLLAAAAIAQWGWGRGPRARPRFPGPDDLADGSFSFCRILYDQVRWEHFGHGWNTDYPDSDMNLMTRLGELTAAPVSHAHGGKPEHWVVRPTDDALFDCPFVFMSDVGTVGFNDLEVEQMRRYLLGGGFLYVDDFWGDEAWHHWSSQIGRILPPSDYPIVDIPTSHPLLHLFFELDEVPQVPSIQHWYRSGGGTSERGHESAEPHLRGIFDDQGRIIVLMTHNTDIADGWEREGESDEFFERFSLTKSYPLGINIVLYSLTH